ncbi:MAG: VC1465 family Xer recombination activation factor [Sulfuricella sp.]
MVNANSSKKASGKGKKLKKLNSEAENHQPSEKTHWAYFMQAIEPKDEAINSAFPGYHPQWLAQSQAMTIAGENFHWMRRSMGLTVEQCAAYLRVASSTVRRWESGRDPVTFAAFELLRVISNTVIFKVSHPRWDGWFINQHDGALVSPDVGNTVTPEEINCIFLLHSKANRLEAENKDISQRLQAMQEENARLREMFVNQGVVDELATMQERIGALMARINTAEVLPFTKPERTLKELAA